MLYVYRQTASASARELAEALEGRRWRGARVPIQQKVRRGDAVICWGEVMPNIDGIRILNNVAIRGKFESAQILQAANVPTVEVSRTRPVVVVQAAAVDPALAIFEQLQEQAGDLGGLVYNRDNPAFRHGVTQLQQEVERLSRALMTPVPNAPARPDAAWVGRNNNHVGGNDLLVPTTTPDYFVRKVELVREFRIHSFQGRSIRAGVKAPREGATPHAWIRSWDGGWRIVYDGVTSKQRHRDLAHQAVQALGLQFGAVDIGEKADGNLVVLEVNRAPGLEGGTIESYAKAIEGWLEGI